MRSHLPLLSCAFATLLSAQTPADKAWAVLSDGSTDKSAENRTKVFQALSLLENNAKARGMAEKALVLDDTGAVRAAAAAALGEMGCKESAPKLIDAARDKETEVVFSATNALFQLGNPAAFQVYYAVLTGERKSGESLADSQMKMLKDPKALTNMGLEAGIGFIPFGGISYKVFKMATADAVSPVRALAAVRLAGDPDPKTGKVLVDATKDPKWLVRAAAVGAIARRNDPALIAAVLPLLNDENATVRFNSAAAIVRLSTAKPRR
jgi:HEAT repeat protein